MAKKHQKEWKIDDWDDSLDDSFTPKLDPFGLPVNRRESIDEWSEIPSEYAKSSRRKNLLYLLREKKRIVVFSAITVVLITCFGIFMYYQGVFIRIFDIYSPTTNAPTSTVSLTPSLTPNFSPTSSPKESELITLFLSPTPKPSPILTPTETPASALYYNEWYDPELRYYFQFLTIHEKEQFSKLYNAAAEYKKHVTLYLYDEKELDHIVYVFQKDCPELFNLNNGLSYSYFGNHYDIDLDYRMEQQQYVRICNKIHSIFDMMYASFPANADEFEKQLVIYRYIIDHCDYLRAGDDSTACADACLYYGKSQCSGYADALSLALRAFGIHDVVVHSSDHAWNMVKIMDEWYNCDVTWDDTGTASCRIPYDPSQDEFNGWMNLPDRLYRADSHHVPIMDDTYPLPQATSLNDSYVTRKATYFPPGISDIAGRITNVLKQADQIGKKYILFMLDDLYYINTWDSIQERLYTVYQNYDWVFYPPVKSHRCVYAVRK